MCCSRGVQITPDVALSDAIKTAASAPSPVADALLLPGGAGGSARLRESAVSTRWIMPYAGARASTHCAVHNASLFGHMMHHSFARLSESCFNDRMLVGKSLQASARPRPCFLRTVFEKVLPSHRILE